MARARSTTHNHDDLAPTRPEKRDRPAIGSVAINRAGSNDANRLKVRACSAARNHGGLIELRGEGRLRTPKSASIVDLRVVLWGRRLSFVLELASAEADVPSVDLGFACHRWGFAIERDVRVMASAPWAWEHLRFAARR